jgi:hypothetical protein
MIYPIFEEKIPTPVSDIMTYTHPAPYTASSEDDPS